MLSPIGQKLLQKPTGGILPPPTFSTPTTFNTQTSTPSYQQGNALTQTGQGILQGVKVADSYTTRPTVKGLAELSLSGAEVVPRITPGLNVPDIIAPKTMPYLSKYTGPLQSFQSQSAQMVQNGSSPLSAIGQGILNTVMNEPAGVAFKPVAAGLGLLGKTAFGKAGIGVIGSMLGKGEKIIETLPKDVHPYIESKAVGAKRIAPDRVPHQQMTPEKGIQSLIEKAKVAAEKNGNSWLKAANDLDGLIAKYGDSLPPRSTDDFYKFSSLKKNAPQAKTLVEMRDKFRMQEQKNGWTPEKEAAYKLKVADEYKSLVKADISKGYKYPDAVLNYDKSFSTAVDSRARYEKGLATSFSADDSRIVFHDVPTIGAGMKRQDGKAIEPKQVDEIKKGVVDFADTLGLDMKKLAENNRWVYVHLNGKNPFLMKQTAGLYREGKDSVSISVGGMESFDHVVNGEKVREKVHTTMAHELGHAIDYKAGKKMFDSGFLYERANDYKPVDFGFRGKKYWSSNSEVTARMIEQYVAVAKGQTGMFDRQGYWSKDIFETQIKPAVEAAIGKHFGEYKKASFTPVPRTEQIANDLATEKRLDAAKQGALNVPTKQLSQIDNLIAQGKVRVVARDGRDVYQVKKGNVWSNARDESSAIKQATETPQKAVLPQALEERKMQLEIKVPHNFDAQKYIAEQIAKRERPVGLLTKGKSFLKEIKSKLVDFTAPIEDVLAQATKKAGIVLKPSEDIHNQIDRVLRAPTLAGQFAKDNGIVEVIQKVDDLDALDQYLIAKHAIELDTRGITTGRDLAKDNALIKELRDTYEPFAKQIKAYSEALLEKSVETGLISKDLAEMLKKRYPDYVPFKRVFDEVERHGGGGGTASLSKQTIVQKIVGSERDIESPIESLLTKTNDVFKQGEKNIAAKMLAGYEKLPGNPFELRELKGSETAQHTISFVDDGVKRTFETTPEIAGAAKSLNVQHLNILGKILALPTRIARIGITGINLPFVASNVAKDQVSAFINSNNGLRSSIANPSVFLKALTGAVGHGKLYEDWIRAGGGGTSFDLAREQVEHTVGSVRAGRNIGSKIKYAVRHPSQLLRAVENIVGRSEEFTRLQQFYGEKGALAHMGEKEANIGAGRASRENTVNFARRGEWGTVLNSAFLYLNASIQGTRTLLRNLKTKPIQTATKIALIGMYPMAQATVWNLSDPDRKKAYEDISEYEKENNIIIIPPNPTKDEQGRWNVIKIPLSQEINNILGLARRPIEQMYGLDPVGFGDFAKALIGTVSPVAPDKGSIASAVVPQAVKPTIEALTNTNLFTGRHPVTQGLENLPPDKQVKPYTSGTARQIGQKLNISPIKVEEWIKATFGGVGSQALNAVDNALASTGLIPKEQVGGQNILDAIGARFGKARGGEVANKGYEAGKIADQKKAAVKADFKTSVYDKVQALVAEGNKAGADAITAKLSPEDYEIYKSIRTSERSKHTERTRELLASDPKAAVAYVRSFPKEEADRITGVMTPAEYAIYKTGI